MNSSIPEGPAESGAALRPRLRVPRVDARRTVSRLVSIAEELTRPVWLQPEQQVMHAGSMSE